MKTKAIIYTLFAGALLGIHSCAPSEEEKKKEESSDPKVEIETVQSTEFTHRIRVQGNVETDKDVMLTSEMSGLIVAINVKDGDKVTQGQVIATIDASILASNKQELETQLDYAKYMLGKQEELNKRGVGSEMELEAAKSQVKALEKSIASLSTQQGKAVVKAPFSGVVDQVFVTTGQMASPASPIIRLVNNKEVDVVATISEKHFSSIRLGTEMTVTFPNYSDTSINLKIDNVGNYIEPTNRTFRIKSTIKNNAFFLPNMLAEISITDLQVPNGIVISSKAIMKDQDNNDYVYKVLSKDGKRKAQKVIIEVVKSYNGQTLIKDGALSPNEEIVVKGARGIADGDTIRTTKS